MKKFRVWNIKEEKYEDSKYWVLSKNGRLYKTRTNKIQEIVLEYVRKEDYKVEFSN